MFGQIMKSVLSVPQIQAGKVGGFEGMGFTYSGSELPSATVSVTNSEVAAVPAKSADYSGAELSTDTAVFSVSAASDSAQNGTSLEATVYAVSDHGVNGAAYYPPFMEHHQVYAGDLYEDIELTNYARMTVYSGGTAALIYINEGSLMTVNSGGYAYGIEISSGGGLILSSGAVAEEVYWIPFEGYLEVAEGAKITYNNRLTGVYYGSGSKLISRGNTISSKSMGGTMYIGNGGTASNNTVDGGIMYVMGGAANNTIVNKGKVDITGGTAQGTVNSKGQVVLNDGSLIETTNNAMLYIYGGTADSITNAEGRMYVNGGSVTNVNVTSYGEAYINSDGHVSGISASYGRVNVLSGGAVTNANLNEWGQMRVSSGGNANIINVNAGGSFTVASGGSCMTLRISSQGSATVYGYANGNNVSSRGVLNVSGSAFGNRISGGTMNVAAGASAVHNYISSGGKLSVNGGSALDINISRGGTLNATNAYVSGVSATSSGAKITISGGSTLNATLTSSGASMQVNGNAYLSGGSVCSSATVNINGNATVSSYAVGIKGIMSAGGGAVLRDIDVAAEGKLTVAKGTLNSVNVASKGSVVINSGATVTNAIVSSGGSMVINGTNVNGLAILKGAVVSAGAGAVFNFDLRNVAAGQFMVVGLDRLQGAPTYTITVSDKQNAGSYYLAVSSDISKMSFTMTIGNGSVNYGTLTMNGSELYYRDKIYSLQNAYGDLCLVVENYISTSETGSSDIDGNGFADIILVNDAGFVGAWLGTGDEKAVKKWGNLSNVKKGVSILGTGNVYASDDNGQDVYYTDGKNVGAWTVVDGKVTGYKNIKSINSTTEILGLGDFDGDNVTDILLRSNNGAVGCHLGNGEGWTYFKSLGKEWEIAAIGDFNGDGRDDLVLRNEAGYAGTWLTQADCTMKWANLDTLSSDTEILGAGDFNGDGVDDVLIKKGNWVGAWIIEDGSITDSIGIDAKMPHTVEQIADFNDDGIDDLRIRSEYGDLGVIYVMGEDSTKWKYWGSVGDEWTTGFSALA